MITIHVVDLTQIFTPKRISPVICNLAYPLLCKPVLKEKMSNIFNFPYSKRKFYHQIDLVVYSRLICLK